MTTEQRIKAIDLIPHRWGIWCTIPDDSQPGGKSKPFVNEICSRKWSDDGESIWFMLESHNFLNKKPDEEIEVVPYVSGMTPGYLAECDERDAKLMAMRPRPSPPKLPCQYCGSAVQPSADTKESNG